MKIIVIDDQEIIIKGIEKLIQINFPEVELRICSNSEKAISIIGEINPDLVITDIRMPQVDGVTLCQIIREKGYDGKIIIISAYDVFEYAKGAISVGVDEYLLKPIDKEKFIELLKRIQKEISLKKDNKEIQNDAIRIARKEFLKNMVQQVGRKDNLKEDCVKLNISGYSHYTLVLIKANQNTLVKTDGSEYGNLIAMADYVFNGNLILSRFKDFIFTSINANFFALLIMDNSEFNEEEFFHVMKEIRKKSLLMFCTGVSSSHNNCSKLYDLYPQSKMAMDYAFKKNENICFFSTLGSRSDKNYMLPDSYEQDILNASLLKDLTGSLALHDIEACNFILNKYFERMGISEKSSEMICEDCYNIYLELFDYLKKYGFDTREILEQKRINYQTFSDCESLDHIKEHLLEFFLLIENYNQKHKSDATHTVTMAKQLVGNNLRDVSLQYVADRIDVNKTYLSNLFKKTTNEKFKDYVKRMKVEEAKKQLKKTSLSIATISENLGYMDAKYFSRIFVDVVGLKPVDFRNNYTH